ncbi:hypothetical protein BDR04DRAFT_1122843 [Suillus decipiens]|nr:hypothetical protein BDR04DRAFT_1122843 [Suillus decipiens]
MSILRPLGSLSLALGVIGRWVQVRRARKELHVHIYFGEFSVSQLEPVIAGVNELSLASTKWKYAPFVHGRGNEPLLVRLLVELCDLELYVEESRVRGLEVLRRPSLGIEGRM